MPRKADPNWVRKQAAFAQRPESAPYYTRPMLVDITGLSRHTIDRLVREEEFPKPLRHNPPELNYTNKLWHRKEFDDWWDTSPLNLVPQRRGKGQRLIKFKPEELRLVETAARCLMKLDHDVEKFIVDAATERAIRVCEFTIRNLDPNDHYDSNTLAPKLEKILEDRERERSFTTGGRRTYSTPHQPVLPKHQPISEGLDDISSAGATSESDDWEFI